MDENQFIKMRKQIEEALKYYKEVFSSCDIKSKWHSETIERISNPFVNGHFTLAVVGKVSSGKSTFINTLIGKDILPTGHFQTTSAITYIEHSDTPKMVVKFADGTDKTYSGDEIKQALRNIVAVPKEYDTLPINDINSLIAGGDNATQIIKKKAEIQDRTRTLASDDLWKKYISSHPKSSIAEEVRLFLPLSDEFLGWRIVDTPGVGAIGGIQDETKKLFAMRDENGNKIVDAIIFLQRGDDNIEDAANVEFVNNTFNQLTDEAKQRLFFVLTHATSQKFRKHQQAILEKANILYANKYAIPTNRLTHVDSLIARFHSDAILQGLDVSTIDTEDNPRILDGWDKEDCEIVYELFSPLKKELKNKGLARNNETLLSLMNEWGNFVTLKAIINGFVKEVKETSFKKIFSLIILDYEGMCTKIENEIEILNGGEINLLSEQKRLQKNRIEYNNILNKLRRLAAIEPILRKFDCIDGELGTLSQKKSIDEVRKTYQDIMDRALCMEKNTFKEIEDEFSEVCKGYDNKDIVLKQIDFSSLIMKAQNASTTKKSIYGTQTYKTGGMSPKTETKTVFTGTEDVVDQEKKRREFTTYVIQHGRSMRESFLEQIKDKNKKMCDFMKIDISEKVAAAEARLNELAVLLTDKDKEIVKLKENCENINTVIKLTRLC